ncbi:MAG: tRNA pseudouridine(38-40) synthase TruA [Gammaproteobacteria bacterium]|jgi:tRNA pseudouridine38-40 synthase|nr:tRNA pseudouridine(38-40) synthase TruA [Gammaproteobacteria bacterium]MDH3848748.1 tRNA pseudouridine(38-40) synthase TruA [Gammaproteobacteria bacterium]MDH3864796.1 tRNA pseudouridine(38-40) synthase TruA [Gammaproteobacteria bacterium]MDH3905225.1 tRNA pseudouridine(38-40) synthase TruA [Gammaproteobacteria bacterium]MDH3954918.1 tRNA pseudouridine(38-40) synthase TruA [Gammaproteobacteria bacterium]
MRIAIGIEYDGTSYSGWQRQRNGLGVQERLEQALGEVADEPVAVTCAGRTDAGVHASGQVAHFDTAAERSERGWLLGANTHLPDDICVTWVKPVGDDFHARFSATARRYRYRILSRLVRSALYRHRAWWLYQDLDHRRMHDAAQALLGKHDFSAFRAAGCQASNAVREVTDIRVARHGDWIVLDVMADAFLQHMVRNITGTLVAIGSGEEEVAWAARVLDGRDRTRAGVAAPPHGLTLVQIFYPDAFAIPAPFELGR